MTAPESYDVIIVGSGAGGAAAAFRLARDGLRVALLEKGQPLPQDGSTLDFNQVVHEGVFKSREPWLDRNGRRFAPEEHFNLGGKTKWYGAALLRYGRHEFEADAAHQCPGWPISYEELEPYYEQAEKLLDVRQFDSEADLERIERRLARCAPPWETNALPMGLAASIVANPLEARHFDGFASVARLKADAETAFLAPLRELANLTVQTGAAVRELIGAATDATTIRGVVLEDGRELHARAIVLAAGALHSPRLLQRYLDAHRLNTVVPCANAVGRNLKYHLLTAVVGISTTSMTDLIRKTRLLTNPKLPHSSVQPLGFDGELISTLMPDFLPRPLARLLGNRAYGFFLQTEDGAHAENRVIAGSDATQGLPVIDYDVARIPAAAAEHRRLVRSFKLDLLRAGLLAFSERVGLAGTARDSGTLSAGSDPTRSVVDSRGQVHGMKSLYVVDGSILPRSSRVNPSLTIFAWSLRAAERLAADLRTSPS